MPLSWRDFAVSVSVCVLLQIDVIPAVSRGVTLMQSLTQQDKLENSFMLEPLVAGDAIHDNMTDAVTGGIAAIA